MIQLCFPWLAHRPFWVASSDIPSIRNILTILCIRLCLTPFTEGSGILELILKYFSLSFFIIYFIAVCELTDCRKCLFGKGKKTKMEDWWFSSSFLAHVTTIQFFMPGVSSWLEPASYPLSSLGWQTGCLRKKGLDFSVSFLSLWL